MASRRDWLKAAALLPPLLFLRDALAQGRLEKGVYRRRGEVKISGDSVSTGADGELVFVIGKDAMLVRHTDAELVFLESLVGREPPFVGKGYKPY